MQSNLFDDLKSIKQKMNKDEKISKEKVIEAQIKEKEEKLQAQFVSFMKHTGVKVIR